MGVGGQTPAEIAAKRLISKQFRKVIQQSYDVYIADKNEEDLEIWKLNRWFLLEPKQVLRCTAEVFVWQFKEFTISY